MRPISRSLELQILAMCERPAPYTIEAVPMGSGAPTTYQELLDQSLTGGDGSMRIPVWTGASDYTIWSCREANWLFRAWHDSHHILLGADFSREGEQHVARYESTLIRGEAECTVLWFETEGQQEYKARHGVYPENQRDFVRDCIVRGIHAACHSGLYHKEG